MKTAMTPKEVLDLPMGDNVADAATVRDYLIALLTAVWEEGESFSGKRPFDNSGWQSDIPTALVKGGAIEGKLDPDGYLDDFDEPDAEALILAAINELGAMATPGASPK